MASKRTSKKSSPKKTEPAQGPDPIAQTREWLKTATTEDVKRALGASRGAAYKLVLADYYRRIGKTVSTEPLPSFLGGK